MIEIIKQRIEAPTRKLNVKWNCEAEYTVRKKPETEEEEAEEIIRRLKEPPKPYDPQQDIMDKLAKHIAEEIDKELLASYGQGTDRTRRHTRTTIDGG